MKNYNAPKVTLSALFLTLLFLGPGASAALAGGEPIAWWDFNNQSEIFAGLVREKGNSYNGQNFNGVSVSGYSGSGLRIIDPSAPSGSGIPGSGGGDGFTVGSFPELSQVTVTFRMKTDGSTNATEQIVVAQNREPSQDLVISYLNGHMNIGVTQNGSLNANLGVDQDWHYYVVSYDGRNIYLYVDGQVKGFASAAGTGKVAASKWVFGVNPLVYETLVSPNTAAGKTVNGITIDEAKIYNHVFSEAEIAYEKDNGQLCYADIWSCADYAACSADGTQTRTCTKTFECPLVVTPSPATSQSCTPPAPTCQADTWSCGEWNACSISGGQTRTCTKTFDCPAFDTASPSTSQSCNPPTQSCDADAWSCGDWNICSVSGNQTRTCTKTFECSTANNASPATTQSCTAPQQQTVTPPTSNVPDRIYNKSFEVSQVASPDADRRIVASTNLSVSCPSKLIKGSQNAVYYCGVDGKRYVFPNSKTYFSWFEDYSQVTVVSDLELASHLIGGLVTYKPGVKMIKIATDPKVYAVSRGGVLRWVTTEGVALKLYGTSWNQHIEDVSDAFFSSYKMGADITESDVVDGP